MTPEEDTPIEERVRQLEKRVAQLMELLQIIPRMDTRQGDFGSASEHAKAVFLSKLAELSEEPLIGAQPIDH